MSTSLVTFRQLMSESQGDWYTADTTGSGSTTTVVDTGLLNEANGGDDDAFEHWYVKITESGHGSEGEIRRVSDYASATGTLTVQSAFTATIGSGVAYELHRIHPNLKDDAINKALDDLYPILYKHVIDSSIVVDNWLLNSNFETFSSGFTSWTEVGSPTVTAETTIVIHGDQSAKVVASGADGQLTQSPHLSLQEMVGKSITIKAWCYTTSASAVRIRLDWDGSNFENSSYHSGEDHWEQLSATGTVPSGATQVKVILEVVDGSTGYFDDCYMIVEGYEVSNYNLPSSIIDGPSFVSEQADSADPNGPHTKIVSPPTAGSRLRIEGMGALSALSADSGTTEVDRPRRALVVAAALQQFNLMQARQSATRDRSRYLEDAKDAEREKDRLSIRLKMPDIGAETPPLGMRQSQWHVETNAGQKILVLDGKVGRIGSGFSRLI